MHKDTQGVSIDINEKKRGSGKAVYPDPRKSEFLRVIFGIDNDEARNIQKAEKPTTSYRNSRQLVTGNSDNKLSENQTETNLYNKPKQQTENNNVVVEFFENTR